MRFDAGLQPERTSLSWNRTALSLVVGGVAGLKVLPDLIGPAGLAVAAVVIACGGTLGVVAHRRAERRVAVLLAGEGDPPDGRLLLALSLLVGLVAALALVLVVAATMPA